MVRAPAARREAGGRRRGARRSTRSHAPWAVPRSRAGRTPRASRSAIGDSSGGARRDSRTLPVSRERRRQRHRPHLARAHVEQTTVGTRDQTGLKNGIPFQISTRPSSGPNLPAASSIGPVTNTRIAAGAADDLYPLCSTTTARACHRGSPHHHLDAGGGPTSRHLVRVQLGAAGLGIVEVPPGEDGHAPQPGPGGEVCHRFHARSRVFWRRRGRSARTRSAGS